MTVSVAAVNPEGQVGAAASSKFTVVGSMSLSLQRRMWGSTTWTSLNTGTTAGNGAKTGPVKHYSKATYRVVAKGVGVTFGSYGPPRVVSTR